MGQGPGVAYVFACWEDERKEPVTVEQKIEFDDRESALERCKWAERKLLNRRGCFMSGAMYFPKDHGHTDEQVLAAIARQVFDSMQRYTGKA